MSQSSRKLAGTVLILLVLVAYSLAATELYATLLTNAPQLVVMVYFLVAGLLWAVPVSFIIRWMAKPDRV